MEWQPIVTAPRDGTRLLLWTGNMSTTGMIWSTTVGWWDKEICHKWIHGSSVDPTHWMPLPAPPCSDPSIPIIRTIDATDEFVKP